MIISSHYNEVVRSHRVSFDSPVVFPRGTVRPLQVSHRGQHERLPVGETNMVSRSCPKDTVWTSDRMRLAEEVGLMRRFIGLVCLAALGFEGLQRF